MQEPMRESIFLEKKVRRCKIRQFPEGAQSAQPRLDQQATFVEDNIWGVQEMRELRAAPSVGSGVEGIVNRMRSEQTDGPSVVWVHSQGEPTEQGESDGQE